MDERVESELSLEGTNESKGKRGAGGGKSNLVVSGLSVKCESGRGEGVDEGLCSWENLL